MNVRSSALEEVRHLACGIMGFVCSSLSVSAGMKQESKFKMLCESAFYVHIEHGITVIKILTRVSLEG